MAAYRLGVLETDQNHVKGEEFRRCRGWLLSRQ